MSRKNKGVEHYFSAIPKCDDRFGIIKTVLRGRNLQFLTSSNVFSKRRVDLGTRVLIEAMVLPKTGNILCWLWLWSSRNNSITSKPVFERFHD